MPNELIVKLEVECYSTGDESRDNPNAKDPKSKKLIVSTARFRPLTLEESLINLEAFHGQAQGSVDLFSLINADFEIGEKYIVEIRKAK